LKDRSPSRPDETLKSRVLPESVQCPFCERRDTEQFSTFGGQASTTQYYCNRCRTVFECFKWR
jgi:transposase-like protein